MIDTTDNCVISGNMSPHSWYDRGVDAVLLLGKFRSRMNGDSLSEIDKVGSSYYYDELKIVSK